jgi:hypothetical protein
MPLAIDVLNASSPRPRCGPHVLNPAFSLLKSAVRFALIALFLTGAGRAELTVVTLNCFICFLP